MRDALVSVVVPCFDEEANIRPLYERLRATLARVTSRWEIILVDNGSTDGSAALLADIARADPSVVVLTYARNFGSQGAYTGGLERARGDCVVCLDGDLQDPPELIEAFVARWRQGCDIVYGERARRRAALWRRAGYKLFYRTLRRLSTIDIPLDASDFALMDRKVVDAVNRLPEKERFPRWLRAWVGFRHEGVPYERAERHGGRSHISLLDMARWASSAIFSFSIVPLELITTMALIVMACSLAATAYFVVAFFRESIPHGITSIIVLLLVLNAAQLLALAIIGGYVGKILIEVKGRPPYVVKEIVDRRPPA